jgi:hypothetical protein
LKILEDLTEELYENMGDECTIELDGDIITIYLNLPNTEYYTNFVSKLERFLVKSKYDIEDFEIDGDYEGQIELAYEGE